MVLIHFIHQRKMKIEYVFNHKARYTNDIYEIYSILSKEDGTNEK